MNIRLPGNDYGDETTTGMFRHASSDPTVERAVCASGGLPAEWRPSQPLRRPASRATPLALGSGGSIARRRRLAACLGRRSAASLWRHPPASAATTVRQPQRGCRRRPRARAAWLPFGELPRGCRRAGDPWGGRWDQVDSYFGPLPEPKHKKYFGIFYEVRCLVTVM